MAATLCAAFINIDLQAVGNWAERNNIAYASYQELAGHPEVYKIIAGHVDETNRKLSREPMMAGAQIRRFLVLHKELDADDGELTRTMKVRRSFIAERYAALIEALYDGSTRKIRRDGNDLRGRPKGRGPRDGEDRGREDLSGRRRRCARRPNERAARAGHLAAPDDGIAPGDLLMDVRNVSLAFGGVKAITDISFDVRKGEIRAIIGPNGAGKTSMLNVINGFYTPQKGRIVFRGKERRAMKPHHAVRQGIARTFQNVALFKGMSTLDNIMAGRSVMMNRNLFWQMLWHGPALAKRSSTARRSRRSSTSSKSSTSGARRSASCPTGCRSASSSAGRSPWSRRCCCSTSRWPA